MKSTVKTEGGTITITATPGRVETNGVKLLPHEAALVAAELARASQRAQLLALDDVMPARQG